MSIGSKKKKIIMFGICLLLIILLVLISLFIPKIKLNLKGNNLIEIEVGSDYKDPGASATVSTIFKNKKIKVNVDGKVDSSKLGNYTVSYFATKNGVVVEKKRTVKVVDTEEPKITLQDKIKACKNNNLVEIKATAEDNYDGDLSDKIEYKIDGDNIYLSVIDSSNNVAELKEQLIFIDDEKPTITLEGKKTINLNLNEKYTESGAKAYDSCDGDITKKIKITGKVDTSKQGSYVINYEVEDALGNKTTVKRTVIVKDNTPAPPVENYNYEKVTNGVVYLTFDDGPGPYTAQILDTLDKYNIKATFFVTSQFSGYLDKITDEYKRGHTVGIHTYSHKWSIYDSVDTYLDDFNKMEQIVFEKTGVHPKYFRFPGGTSNEVSAKHSKGIMTTLSKLMPEKGYTYFDWNVDSCDTCKKNSVNDIISTIKTYVKSNGTYIILMHDIKKNTRDALPSVIEYLKNKGYVFKSIDDNTPKRQFAPHN